MPQVAELPAEVDSLRSDWVARVSALVDQVAAWAEAEGWRIERRTETSPSADWAPTTPQP